MRPKFGATSFSRRPFVRFLVTGGVATLAYTILAALVATRWPELRQPAGAVIYIAMVPLSFFAQRRFVFRSSNPLAQEFLRYAALQAAAIVLASLVIPRFATGPFAWKVGVYGLNAAVAAGVSYVLCSLVIFRGRREPA
jgi:putative flippase GtrA